MAEPSLNAPPIAPAHLSEASRKLWERICEESQIDAAAEQILLSLCESRDRRQQAREAILTDGAVYKDRFNCPKVNPWVAVERDATLIMHRAFRLLGFDQEPRASQQGELFIS
jgi:P27 family predicted phage terminase small subunit